jgi:hypothetical protein
LANLARYHATMSKSNAGTRIPMPLPLSPTPWKSS